MGALDNLQHERFCQEYVTSMLDPSRGLGVPNASHAAIASGYSSRGRCAKVTASKLLDRTDITDRIAELQLDQSAAWKDKRELLIGKIVSRLWDLAFSGIRTIELPDGRVASLEASGTDPDQLMLNLDFPKEVITSRKLRDVVKTSDQLRAYEMLLKILDAFGDDDLPPLTGDEPGKLAVDLV